MCLCIMLKSVIISLSYSLFCTSVPMGTASYQANYICSYIGWRLFCTDVSVEAPYIPRTLCLFVRQYQLEVLVESEPLTVTLKSVTLDI
ncbi:hypothetical protein BDD12DRAFT_860150 [Trichophaea hybrida]|nr:hypothetical protein BDD12DRAFT_860150 [Trichophaea hybrida]